MKVITDYEQLVGKTISFVHMAQFADQITIATTDKEVLMATFDFDEFEGESEIRVLNKHQVIKAIQDNVYLQKELDKLGIFNLEEFKKEQEKKQREEMELYKKQQEEKERKLLAELKAKYENN
jgi:hypothetical protein